MIAQAPNGPFPTDSTLHIPDLEVVGTLKGVMQVGSSVAEGESQALCEAARRTSGIIQGCVDNKAAIAQQKMRICRRNGRTSGVTRCHPPDSNWNGLKATRPRKSFSPIGRKLTGGNGL